MLLGMLCKWAAHPPMSKTAVLQLVSIHAVPTGKLLATYTISQLTGEAFPHRANFSHELEWSPCMERPVLLFTTGLPRPSSRVLLGADGRCTILPAEPNQHVMHSRARDHRVAAL